MSLQNWLNNGWLAEHRTSPQQITALLAVADRDLSDCRTSGLSSDWKLNIAYNAALCSHSLLLPPRGIAPFVGHIITGLFILLPIQSKQMPAWFLC